MPDLDKNSINAEETRPVTDSLDEEEFWDPFVSVQDIAREFGVHIQTVIDLVASQTIRSVDKGLLAREGVVDIPVARLSWANEVRNDSEQSWRRIDNANPGVLHPAAQVAADFFDHLRDRDAFDAMELCLPETTEGVSDELFVAVSEAVIAQEAFSPGAGVTSAVYTLDPLDAVGVRVVRDAEFLPAVIERPTPVTLLAVIPLKETSSGWSVDFSLFIEQSRLREILQSGVDPDSNASSPADEASSE